MLSSTVRGDQKGSQLVNHDPPRHIRRNSGARLREDWNREPQGDSHGSRRGGRRQLIQQEPEAGLGAGRRAPEHDTEGLGLPNPDLGYWRADGQVGGCLQKIGVPGLRLLEWPDLHGGSSVGVVGNRKRCSHLAREKLDLDWRYLEPLAVRLATEEEQGSNDCGHSGRTC